MASLEEILAAKAAQHTEDSAGILNAAITTGAGGGALVLAGYGRSGHAGAWGLPPLIQPHELFHLEGCRPDLRLRQSRGDGLPL